MRQHPGIEVAHPARRHRQLLGAIPYPALIGLKGGGFGVLGIGSTKGRARLIDPIGRAAQELSIEEIADQSSGELVLITRGSAGPASIPTRSASAGFSPRSCATGPRCPLLIASLFVQIFALATPIFFQLVVDKVLVHRGSRP